MQIYYFLSFNLYEVEDNDTEHLIEDINTIPSIIKSGSKICVEVGHIPKEYITKNYNVMSTFRTIKVKREVARAKANAYRVINGKKY